MATFFPSVKSESIWHSVSDHLVLGDAYELVPGKEPGYLDLSLDKAPKRAFKAIVFKVAKFDPSLHPRGYKGMFIDTPDKIEIKDAKIGDTVATKSGKAFRIDSKDGDKIKAHIVDSATGQVERSMVAFPGDIEVARFAPVAEVGVDFHVGDLNPGTYFQRENDTRGVVLRYDEQFHQIEWQRVDENGDLFGEYKYMPMGETVTASTPAIKDVDAKMVAEVEEARYSDRSYTDILARVYQGWESRILMDVIADDAHLAQEDRDEFDSTERYSKIMAPADKAVARMEAVREAGFLTAEDFHSRYTKIMKEYEQERMEMLQEMAIEGAYSGNPELQSKMHGIINEGHDNLRVAAIQLEDHTYGKAISALEKNNRVVYPPTVEEMIRARFSKVEPIPRYWNSEQVYPDALTDEDIDKIIDIYHENIGDDEVDLTIRIQRIIAGRAVLDPENATDEEKAKLRALYAWRIDDLIVKDQNQWMNFLTSTLNVEQAKIKPDYDVIRAAQFLKLAAEPHTTLPPEVGRWWLDMILEPDEFPDRDALRKMFDDLEGFYLVELLDNADYYTDNQRTRKESKTLDPEMAVPPNPKKWVQQFIRDNQRINDINETHGHHADGKIISDDGYIVGMGNNHAPLSPSMKVSDVQSWVEVMQNRLPGYERMPRDERDDFVVEISQAISKYKEDVQAYDLLTTTGILISKSDQSVLEDVNDQPMHYPPGVGEFTEIWIEPVVHVPLPPDFLGDKEERDRFISQTKNGETVETEYQVVRYDGAGQYPVQVLSGLLNYEEAKKLAMRQPAHEPVYSEPLGGEIPETKRTILRGPQPDLYIPELRRDWDASELQGKSFNSALEELKAMGFNQHVLDSPDVPDMPDAYLKEFQAEAINHVLSGTLGDRFYEVEVDDQDFDNLTSPDAETVYGWLTAITHPNEDMLEGEAFQQLYDDWTTEVMDAVAQAKIEAGDKWEASHQSRHYVFDGIRGNLYLEVDIDDRVTGVSYQGMSYSEGIRSAEGLYSRLQDRLNAGLPIPDDLDPRNDPNVEARNSGSRQLVFDLAIGAQNGVTQAKIDLHNDSYRQINYETDEEIERQIKENEPEIFDSIIGPEHPLWNEFSVLKNSPYRWQGEPQVPQSFGAHIEAQLPMGYMSIGYDTSNSSFTVDRQSGDYTMDELKGVMIASRNIAVMDMVLHGDKLPIEYLTVHEVTDPETGELPSGNDVESSLSLRESLLGASGRFDPDNQFSNDMRVKAGGIWWVARNTPGAGYRIARIDQDGATGPLDTYENIHDLEFDHGPMTHVATARVADMPKLLADIGKAIDNPNAEETPLKYISNEHDYLHRRADEYDKLMDAAVEAAELDQKDQLKMLVDEKLAGAISLHKQMNGITLSDPAHVEAASLRMSLPLWDEIEFVPQDLAQVEDMARVLNGRSMARSIPVFTTGGLIKDGVIKSRFDRTDAVVESSLDDVVIQRMVAAGAERVENSQDINDIYGYHGSGEIYAGHMMLVVEEAGRPIAEQERAEATNQLLVRFGDISEPPSDASTEEKLNWFTSRYADMREPDRTTPLQAGDRVDGILGAEMGSYSWTKNIGVIEDLDGPNGAIVIRVTNPAFTDETGIEVGDTANMTDRSIRRADREDLVHVSSLEAGDTFAWRYGDVTQNGGVFNGVVLEKTDDYLKAELVRENGSSETVTWPTYMQKDIYVAKDKVYKEAAYVAFDESLVTKEQRVEYVEYSQVGDLEPDGQGLTTGAPTSQRGQIRLIGYSPGQAIRKLKELGIIHDIEDTIPRDQLMHGRGASEIQKTGVGIVPIGEYTPILPEYIRGEAPLPEPRQAISHGITGGNVLSIIAKDGALLSISERIRLGTATSTNSGSSPKGDVRSGIDGSIFALLGLSGWGDSKIIFDDTMYLRRDIILSERDYGGNTSRYMSYRNWHNRMRSEAFEEGRDSLYDPLSAGARSAHIVGQWDSSAEWNPQFEVSVENWRAVRVNSPQERDRIVTLFQDMYNAGLISRIPLVYVNHEVPDDNGFYDYTS